MEVTIRKYKGIIPKHVIYKTDAIELTSLLPDEITLIPKESGAVISRSHFNNGIPYDITVTLNSGTDFTSHGYVVGKVSTNG
jgi:hypothetical protein